jgi:hypothetical protein
LPKRYGPPRREPARKEPIGILELDRFSEANLNRWREISNDLDELQSVLYFNLVPERRRHRDDLLQAVATATPLSLELKSWARIVTYRYSNAPLSCAGSLQAYGGRFNAGVDLDQDVGMGPWPALYVGSDYETAFREKFQLSSDARVSGLSPEELALQQGQSHSAVFVNGHLSRVFDMRTPAALEGIARVLGRIRMPARAKDLKKKLSIPPGGITMILNGRSLYKAMVEQNWRQMPVQFGLPAPTHIIAELLRAAEFEAVLYHSTKGPGDCLAIYPDKLSSDSFVSLVGAPPEGVALSRLDEDSAPQLCGWDTVPRQFRPAL